MDEITRLQRLGDLEAWKRAGRLKADLRSYFRPWDILTRMNPKTWATLETWTPSAGGVFFHGPTGVGKTAAARYLMARAWWAGRTVAETTGPFFVLQCSGFEDHARRATLERVQVLLVDDLDKARFTEHSLMALWEVMNTRHARRLPTLITANMTPADLCAAWTGTTRNETLGVSILRRLIPVMDCPMEGEDVRLHPDYGRRIRE